MKRSLELCGGEVCEDRETSWETFCRVTQVREMVTWAYLLVLEKEWMNSRDTQ